jgi:hypothetical protein
MVAAGSHPGRRDLAFAASRGHHQCSVHALSIEQLIRVERPSRSDPGGRSEPANGDAGRNRAGRSRLPITRIATGSVPVRSCSPWGAPRPPTRTRSRSARSRCWKAAWSSLHCFVSRVTVAGDSPAAEPRNCSSAGTKSPRTAVQVEQRQHLADLGRLAAPRRQDLRGEPHPLAGGRVHPLVVHARGRDLDGSCGAGHGAGPVVAVTDHQTTPGLHPSQRPTRPMLRAGPSIKLASPGTAA